MTPPIDKEEEDKLHDLFYEEKNYFGRDRLYKLAKSQGINVSRRQVMDWLKQQEIHQLYRQKKPSHDITSTITRDAYKQIGIDLADMSNMEYQGNKWMLTGIDLFTKKAWAIPMKDKKDGTVLIAFKKMLRRMKQKPSSIRSDNGSEFTNKKFKDHLKENGIRQVLSLPSKPQSNGQIERFNGILKRLIKIALTLDNSKDWVSILDKLVSNYNNTKHAITNKTPNEMEEGQFNKKDVVDRIEKNATISRIQFKVGDKVRIKEDKNKSGQNWSSKLYKIHKAVKPRKLGIAVYYNIKDFGKKKFYNNDLLFIPSVEHPIIQEETFEISKLIRPAVSKGVKGFIVKWKGYSSKYNTFEPRDTLLEDIPKMVHKFEKQHDVVWTPKRYTWKE